MQRQKLSTGRYSGPDYVDGGLIPMATTPAKTFAYAPAPESRAVVDIAPSYGLFIDGEFAEAADGKVFKTVSPSSEEVLSEVAQAGAEDVDRAVKPPARPSPPGPPYPARSAAKYLFPYRPHHPGALARIRRPGIPGQRQADPRDPRRRPAARRRALLLLRGLGRKLRYAGYGPDPKPLGVAGQIIPWNFPLLMLAGRSPRPSPPATRWS